MPNLLTDVIILLYVHECVEAQPHSFDPGNHHPGDHSLLLPGAHLDAGCAHSQRTDRYTNPIPDIHSQPYSNLHPDRHAQHDFDWDCHQHIDAKPQLDSHLDIHSNIKTNHHFKTNFHADYHTTAHIDTDLHTAVHMDAYLHIYPNTDPF